MSVSNMPIKGNIIERLLRTGAITSDEAKELLDKDRHEPFEIYKETNRKLNDNHYTIDPYDLKQLVKPE